MKAVRVDIRVQSERELKVVWNEETPWPAYTIHRKAVEDCARAIRAVLRELVDAALAGRLGEAGPTLKTLGRRGAELHSALFAALSNEAEAARIRDYYEQPEPFRLRFCVSDSVYVPWGLVYGGDPEALPEAPDPRDWKAFEAFWCFSHELATVYERIAPDAAGRGKGAEALRALWVAQPDALTGAEAQMPGGPEEEVIRWLRERYGEPLSSSQALKKHWREAGAETGLLYFYCHASATKLALGDDEKIEASQLFLTLSGAERRPGTAGCLVLINGCSTAVGDPSGDFILSTSQRGLCGFVGTEAEVPDIFALRFSLALLELLFGRRLTLGEAMQVLYREHFPLSLLYGIYAHPGFRMPQSGMPAPPAALARNFSFEKVGTNRLDGDHGC
jgi:hypothetical protein